MISKQGNLTLELTDYLRSNFRRQRESGVQAHDGKRLQGSDFGAEQILSDHGLCAICADQYVARNFGAVFEGCCDSWFSFVGVIGNGAEFLVVL